MLENHILPIGNMDLNALTHVKLDPDCCSGFAGARTHVWMKRKAESSRSTRTSSIHHGSKPPSHVSNLMGAKLWQALSSGYIYTSSYCAFALPSLEQ